MIKQWKETERKTLLSTRVFELQERRSINPRTGREIPFYVFESTPWVNVIPLTDDGRVIMVRQYRQGTQTITLEVPGGMAEPGEAPEEGARREFREETGYEADQWTLLGAVDSNPAIQSNATWTYLARGLRGAHGQQLDHEEDVEVVEVKLADVEKLISEGAITHSLVIAAFYWLDRHRNIETRAREALADLLQAESDPAARVGIELAQAELLKISREIP